MRSKIVYRVALAGLLMLSSSISAWSSAEPFSDYSFEEAKQQAQKDEKFLLLDFTASWCPPCKMMESTTWTNSEVRSWLKENAVAIQIDVDKNTKTSAALHIEAMPTMVLFTPKNATEEFGRQVGYLDPTEMLHWLEGAKSGKTAQQLEKEEDKTTRNNVFEHLGKARELQSAEKKSEALDEYIWIWNHASSSDPNVAPIRASVVPMEAKRLIAVIPAGKASFTELRDAAEKSGNRQDWIILNTLLDDDARTIKWFDAAKLDSKQVAAIQKQSAPLETVLFNKSKWTDVATYLYPDPQAKLREIFKQAEDMKKPRADTEVSKDFDPFPSMVMMLYGAYVGAGKDAEAQKIAAECLRLDDTPAMREGLKNMEQGMRLARGVPTKKSH